MWSIAFLLLHPIQMYLHLASGCAAFCDGNLGKSALQAPKIHQKGVPLHPIVCTFGSLIYTLAKELTRILSPFIKGKIRDTNNLHFSADMPHRFSEGSHEAIRWRPCGNTWIASAAMCGSSMHLYNAEDIRGWTRKHSYSTEDRYWLLNPYSHATAEALSNGQPFCHMHPHIRFVQIQLAVILNVCYKQMLGCSCTYTVDDSGSIRRCLWMLWVHVHKATVDRCTAWTVTLTPLLLFLYVRISLKL